MTRLLVLAVLVLVLGTGLGLLTPSGRALVDWAREQVSLFLTLRELRAELALSDEMVAMRDGVRLATDVYLPRHAERPLPTILVRLPYGKRRYSEVKRWLRVFLPRGYAVVVQDMRGRFASEGVFAPYPNAASDGGATLDWIGAQPWSDGQVGTVGCSALGESQIILGTARHPAHRAMIPIGAGGAVGTARGIYGFFGVFEGGIPTLATAFGWFTQHGGKTGENMGGVPIDDETALATLPLRDSVARFRPDPTDFEMLLDGFGNPDVAETWGYVSDRDRFATPALIADGWFDSSVGASFAVADLMRESGHSPRVVVAPGTHCDLNGGFRDGRVGDVPVDPEQAVDFDTLYADFMDAKLKPSAPRELAPFTVYVLREDRWLELESWPAENARFVGLRLAGEALLLPDEAPADVGARHFTSDPSDPVPTLGGAICCTGDPETREGPIDQRPIEGREDLLVFTSAPLSEALRLAGPIAAKLRVSADVPDTDLVVRLTEVTPEGQSLTISEAGLRLRYRDGFDRPRLMDPGRTYDVTVRLADIAWLVRPGHRLRLHVAGSSFPRLALNMNGGGDPHIELTPKPARISLYSEPGGWSEVLLSVLPDG
jgi:putative CocE/NonD family hydrolase